MQRIMWLGARVRRALFTGFRPGPSPGHTTPVELLTSRRAIMSGSTTGRWQAILATFALILAVLPLAATGSAEAQSVPVFGVDRSWGVWVRDFAANGWVTITVDSTVVYGPFQTDGGGDANIGFDPALDLEVGDVVTVSDGTSTKTLTVVDVPVWFDEMDLTVSGIAPAGSQVRVDFGPAWREVTAEGDGSWVAHLGMAPGQDSEGQGQLTVFGGNMGGAAMVCDEDRDCIAISFRAPYIHVSPVDDHLFGDNWAPGPVTVKVNDVSLLPEPDENGHLEFSFTDYGINVADGDVVVATQHGWIADVEVVLVEITAVNTATGVVSGSAPDGALVDVVAWTDNGSARRVATATNGMFSVNFSIEGVPDDWEPNTVTLTPGSKLRAHVYDDRYYPDHDATYHDRNLPTAYEVFTFGPPVDVAATNVAKAGRTIAVKWRVEFYGEPVSDPGHFVSVTSQTSQGAPTYDDQIETYSGNSGLQYLGDGWWQYNWKTPKSYAGQTFVMVLTLADGSTYTAYFDFR